MSNTTLVIGASMKESRYSNIVIHRLVAKGHSVKAFGIKEGVVSGISIDTKLEKYTGISTVTMYLSPINQKFFYNYICSLHPKRVIFNPGTENQEFIHVLNKKQIETQIACTLVLLSTNQY